MIIRMLLKRIKRLEEAVRWLALHTVNGGGMDVAPDVIKEMWKDQR